MRKIGVVIAYYNRAHLLRNTLKTIFTTEHTDYRIVIVDDASSEPLDLPDVEIIRVDPHEKTWTCPVIPYNMGIARVLDADIIVIQNAECAHFGDVLMYANDLVTDTNYISFGCWSLAEGRTLDDVWPDIIADNPLRTDGGGTGWYNHPRWNVRRFHFCMAMSKQTMLDLNGFDERFKDGAGYDDNDLVRRLSRMKRWFIMTNEYEPFVVHQWHDRDHVSEAGYQKNQALYLRIEQEENYRAHHILTGDFECPES
jgi:glycosyltransferase involved in cell wall biosynthesis